MEERGRGKPRQERGILHRVPRPVATPAELGVSPCSSQDDSDRERAPREEGPAASRREPALVELAGEQRGHRERERDRETYESGVEERGMHEHPGRLKERVQALTIGRNRRQSYE